MEHMADAKYMPHSRMDLPIPCVRETAFRFSVQAPRFQLPVLQAGHRVLSYTFRLIETDNLACSIGSDTRHPARKNSPNRVLGFLGRGQIGFLHVFQKCPRPDRQAYLATRTIRADSSRTVLDVEALLSRRSTGHSNTRLTYTT